MKNKITAFKTISFLLFFFVSTFHWENYALAQPFTGDKTPQIANTKIKVQKTKALEGAWKLKKAKWGNMEDFREETRTIIKMYTQGHFFFIYDKEGEFNGAGGGTYTSTENTFTETISYFSWDSTAAGTAQTFNFEIVDGVLHQHGILNSEKYQNYTIDEYYERVEDTGADNPLVGVWEATKVKYSDSKDNPPNNNLRLIKAITPTHFYAVTYHAKSGVFDNATFGTYSYQKNKLAETILTTSRDQEAMGQTFDFKVKMAENGFRQKGKVNTPKYPNFKIMETYSRLE